MRIVSGIRTLAEVYGGGEMKTRLIEVSAIIRPGLNYCGAQRGRISLTCPV
jgi:hypothetical protein